MIDDLVQMRKRLHEIPWGSAPDNDSSKFEVFLKIEFKFSCNSQVQENFTSLFRKKGAKRVGMRRSARLQERSYVAKKEADKFKRTVVPLHTEGYQIFRNQLDITDEMVEAVCKQIKGAGAIFNYNEESRSDAKRRQCNLKMRSKHVQSLVSSVNDFIRDEITSTLSVNTWVVLHSRSGCQVQAAHTDYEATAALRNAKDEEMPLLIIIAIMPGTKIDLWPKSIRLTTAESFTYADMKPIPRMVAELDRGDVLIFRGDMIHAGSAYDVENIRLHAFIDSPVVPRHPNRTWVVHHQGNEVLKSKVGT